MLKQKEAIKGTAGRELTISRLFNAPRELMWEVWTKPEHIKLWWGPNGFTNTIFQMDVQPGGIWDFIMHGPDGTDYKNKSMYKEVIKPEKLVYDHLTGPHFQFTVTFTEQGNKTLVTIQMLFETPEQRDQTVKVFNAADGLKQNMDKLEVFLEKFSPDKELTITRIIHAPVEIVWKALTDKEQIKQWYFDLKEFKPEVGFEFQFDGNSDDKIYHHLCKITEVIAGKKIAYSWKYQDYEGSSIVSFELFAEGNKTRLKLTHEGLETFPQNNPDFAKESFTGGWTHFIGSALPAFLEKTYTPI